LQRTLSEYWRKSEFPPKTLAAWFPERLSFLLARDNYHQLMIRMRDHGIVIDHA
jgi:hypothetical protein